MAEKIKNHGLNLDNPCAGVTPDNVARAAWSSHFENPAKKLAEFGGILRMTGSERVLRNAVVQNRSTFVLGPEARVECDTPNVVARLEIGLFPDARGLRDVMYGVRLLQVNEEDAGKAGYERNARELGAIGLGSLDEAHLSRVADPILRALAENVEISEGIVRDSISKVINTQKSGLGALVVGKENS